MKVPRYNYRSQFGENPEVLFTELREMLLGGQYILTEDVVLYSDGGGKTHALLALFHLLRSRDSIDVGDLAGLPDPGPGRVAVLSGLDLDPWTPRDVEGMPSEAWQPPTYKEWFDLVRSALAILSTLLRDNETVVREAAVKALADVVEIRDDEDREERRLRGDQAHHADSTA